SAAPRAARPRRRGARGARGARRGAVVRDLSPSLFRSSQNEEGPCRGPLNLGPTGSLDRLDVGRLRALIALHNLERHTLAFGQRLVAVHRDRREVDEDVVAAFALDEAIALLVREPLDGALSQTFLLADKRRLGHRAADR